MESNNLRFTISELQATRENDLFCHDLLQDWLDRCEELALTCPLSTVEDWFTVMAMKCRFKRLAPSFQNEGGVADAIRLIDEEWNKLTLEQINASIDLFDTDYWIKTLNWYCNEWLDDRITSEDLFDNASELASDLDDFGSVLSLAAKQGLCPVESSSRWSDFDHCTHLLVESEPVRIVLSRWIQSMAGLINESITETDYDLGYTAQSLWANWLSWLKTDERIANGHPDYLQWRKHYLLTLMREHMQKNKQPVRILSSLWEQVTGQRQVLLAAATDSADENTIIETWFSPDQKYYAIAEFSKDMKGVNQITFGVYNKESDSPITNYADVVLKFGGVVLTANSEGIFLLKENDFQETSSGYIKDFSVRMPDQNDFIVWNQKWKNLK